MQNSDWISMKQVLSQKPRRSPEVYTLKNIVMLGWCGCRTSHDMGANLGMGDRTLEAMVDGVWCRLGSLRPISSGVMLNTLGWGFWISVLRCYLVIRRWTVPKEMQSCHDQLHWTHGIPVGQWPFEECAHIALDKWIMCMI
jgi:hypothetical protein